MIPFEADSQDRFIPGGEMDPRVKPHRRQVRCRCAMARRFRGGSRSRWRSKAREVDRVGPCRTATEMLVMAMAARRQIGRATWFRRPGERVRRLGIDRKSVV